MREAIVVSDSAAEGKAPYFTENFIDAVYSILTPAESERLNHFIREGRIADFHSNSFLFRGISGQKLFDFFSDPDGLMHPKPGRMDSRAVFCSDNPTHAEQYANDSRARVIVVFNKRKVEFKNGEPLRLNGTPEEKAHAKETLDSLLKSLVANIQNGDGSEEQRERLIKDAVYDVQNLADVIAEDGIHELRTAQSIHAVDAIIVGSKNNNGFWVFKPENRGHILALKELVEAVRNTE